MSIRTTTALLAALAITLSLSSVSESVAADNPYAGRYSGWETLNGKRFRIRARVTKEGKITIVDIESKQGSAQLEGNRFHIIRNQPYQEFKGKIEGNTITGVTFGNRTFGDGTFTATKK